MYDIIVVGAGPAGLTSALYASRAGKNVLVIEANSYGGKIVNAAKIENYPAIELISGFDFATNLYNQVKKFGVHFKFETVLRVESDKTVVTTKDKYKAKAVILATGSFNKKLNIYNEDKFIGSGVSYCATCDGNFYKNKNVAVIGSGETALQDALYLSDIANTVYIINRNDSFKTISNVTKIIEEKENINVFYNSKVVRINGDSRVTSITMLDNNSEKEINLDGIFIAIGEEPKNEIFKNVVDVDEKGYIKSEDGVHTKTPGIYVAGDTRVKDLRQLTTAVSDGSLAATIAIKELS